MSGLALLAISLGLAARHGGWMAARVGAARLGRVREGVELWRGGAQRGGPNTLFEGHRAGGNVELQAPFWRVGMALPVIESGNVSGGTKGCSGSVKPRSWGSVVGILPLRVGYPCPSGGLQARASVLGSTQ